MAYPYDVFSNYVPGLTDALSGLNPMIALGDTVYGGISPYAGIPTRLAGTITAVKQFYTQTGTGTVSAPPAWATLSLADLGNINSPRLLGRATAGAGLIEQLTLNADLSFTGTALQVAAYTGDVTKAAGGTVLTIANSAVTLAKMANVATATVFYRKTAGTGAPEVQTLATLKTDLGLTGTNSGDVTLTGQNYLSIAGQVITVNPVDISGTNITGTLLIANGGTGQNTPSLAFNALSPITTRGDLIYGNTIGGSSRLAGNGTIVKQFLSGTGDGVNAGTPAWATLTSSDISGLGTMATQNANNVSITGGSMSGVNVTSIPNANFSLNDTANNNQLSITPSEDLTANRILSISVNNANRTLTIAASATISNTNTGDQTTSGTTDRISVTNGTTNPVIDIAATYVGQTSITTLGTIGAGTWQGARVQPPYGGTGQNTVDTGQLLYGSSADHWSRLPGNTTNIRQVLSSTGSAGVATAPIWSEVDTRTTVTDSSASVSPAATDSSTYYRLSNASPTFNLPASAGCTIGTTIFWVQSVGGTLTIDPNGTDEVEGFSYTTGNITANAPYSSSATFTLPRYVYAEFRYVASGKWALIGAWAQT